MTSHNPLLIRELDAALAWWRAAGMDCDFHDDVTVLLAERMPDAGPGTAVSKGGRAALSGESGASQDSAIGRMVADAVPSPAPVRPDLLGDSPPQDLAAFRDWWLQASGLDTGGLYPRVPPRGAAGAALMVLVPQPEDDDAERLLDGAQGRLLANILAAMGHGEDGAYLAAALPSHTPMADFAGIAARGMDRVLLHHIALAAPKRLLVLGSGLGAILNAEKEQALREINYGAGKVPVMVSETLEAMMDMPRLKARFWRRFMEWSATL